VTARRPLLLVAAACVVATILGFVVGEGRTVALAAALALAAAVAAAVAWELRPARKDPSRRPWSDDELPLRLRQIVDVLRDSRESAFGVDRSLRPLLVPIAAARLGRRGVDMALAPGRAAELLGDGLWELVRSDRTSVASRAGRGIADGDLRAAIERLEQL
jgi:hypothetical protein